MRPTPAQEPATDRLCTPESFLDLVRQIGPIGRDPFPCATMTTAPRIAEIDGWDAFAPAADWVVGCEPGEVVFIQPPYSRGNLPQCARHWAQQDFSSVHGIALVPAATGTVWFDKMANSNTRAFLLWRGRITFCENGYETKGGGKFDSAVFYNGPSPYLFAHVFEKYGRLVLS